MNACITRVPEGGSGCGEEGDIPVLSAIFKWFVSHVWGALNLWEACFSPALVFHLLSCFLHVILCNFPLLLPVLICLYAHKRPGFWEKSGKGTTTTWWLNNNIANGQWSDSSLSQEYLRAYWCRMWWLFFSFLSAGISYTDFPRIWMHFYSFSDLMTILISD